MKFNDFSYNLNCENKNISYINLKNNSSFFLNLRNNIFKWIK